MSSCAKLLVVVMVIQVSCEEIKGTRQPRIFSFNPESEDVEVGLDFSIPFLKIPVKKSFNALAQFGIPGLSLSKININPMALIIGGMIILFLTVFAPFFTKSYDFHHFPGRHSRLFDNEDFTNFSSFNITEQFLVNSGGCPEKFACWASRRTKNPEAIQTWKQILGNELLSSLVNTTSLKEATIKGRKGQNCEIYSPCPIQEEALPKLINSFAILTNSKI